MKCMSVNAPSTGADLAEQYRRQGWKTSSETIKVFCWGFAGWSLSKALTKHRLVELTNKRASKSITDGTEKALADSSPGLIGQAGSPGRECLKLRDPKHLMTQGYITINSSQSIHRMYCYS